MNQRTFNFATARRDDPITSHRAADTMNQGDILSRCEKYALDAIRKYPGRTAKELEKLMRDESGVIHRRIAGLVRKDKVKRTYFDGCKEARLWLR